MAAATAAAAPSRTSAAFSVVGALLLALALGIEAVWSGRIEPVWLAVVALLPLALFDVLAGLPAAALAYQRLRGSAVLASWTVKARPPSNGGFFHRDGTNMFSTGSGR